MEPKNRKRLTTSIKDKRLEKNMSQNELAERVGVRRETIIRLEKGSYNPSLELAYDISRVLGIGIEELFTFVAEND